MKVLFVFILPSGGMNTLNRTRVRALRRIGIDAHLLYFRTGSGAADLEPDIPVYYTEHPAEIGALLHAHVFDAIVVTSLIFHLPLFRQLGYAGRLIFENQGFGTPEQTRQAMRDAQPYLDGYADALLSPPTEHIVHAFREVCPHKLIFAFPNVFDADAFGYVTSDANPDRPVLAWMGRLEENKNWRDCLRIGAETAKSVPNLHLWLFTDPSLAMPGEEERFHGLVRELGMSDRITQYHRIPHGRMPDYLSRVADSGGLLMVTSQGESGAYAAVEALSCGCPVVTTDSGGVRIAVVDEVTGLYYPHGDIAGGAFQAERLIRDPGLRKTLVRQGLRRVRTEFSMDGYAQNFADMLRALGVPLC